MWIRTSFKSLISTPTRRRTTRRPPASRLLVEPLEDRCLPSANGLVINEVMTGDIGNPASEFVELFNGGSSNLSLSGWKLVYRSAAEGRWLEVEELRLPA